MSKNIYPTLYRKECKTTFPLSYYRKKFLNWANSKSKILKRQEVNSNGSLDIDN